MTTLKEYIISLLGKPTTEDMGDGTFKHTWKRLNPEDFTDEELKKLSDAGLAAGEAGREARKIIMETMTECHEKKEPIK